MAGIIGYETAWTQTRKKLISDLEEFKKIYEKTMNAKNPKNDLYYKIKGLEHAIREINRVHEKYNLCVHENAVIEDPWDNREMFCPDCGKRFRDVSI